MARFTDGDVVAVASEAAKAARECEDDYKKSAARAWGVAALAERDRKAEARKSLREALAPLPFSLSVMEVNCIRKRSFSGSAGS